MNHIYNSDFFNYIEQGSRSSAQVISQLLLENLKIRSVLDVGCGRGAWLDEWRKSGVSDYIGLDGEYVLQNPLVIDSSKFQPRNLSLSFDLNRKFDLVQSLEVAEHLPESAAESLISSIVRHGDIVMFSAATPGQGGENHINEQPLEYWRSIFNKHGYEAYDFIRPQVRNNKDVMEWYQNNTLIYANEDGRKRLSKEVQDTIVPSDAKIAEFGSIFWRLRKTVVGILPESAVRLIAKANAWRVSHFRNY